MSSSSSEPRPNPRFRRRRKFQGATWTPTNQSADIGDGEWCKSCHKRHGYKTMGMNYDKTSSGKWKILWSCPKTGDVIKEQEL